MYACVMIRHMHMIFSLDQVLQITLELTHVVETNILIIWY